MNKIKLFFILLIICIVNSFSAYAREPLMLTYDGGVHEYNGSVFKLIVSNRELDDLPMPPIIFNDRALVPLREIFEELGAEVNYNNSTQGIEVTYNTNYIVMHINDNTAYINGRKQAIPNNIVPKLISCNDGLTKTMVPVRFISETVGIPVDFSSEHESILVNSEGYDFDNPQEYIPETEAPEEEEEVVEDVSTEGNVTDISYDIKSDTTIEISIECDYEIGDYSIFSMEAPNRVVVDISGFKMGVTDNINIGSGAFTSIRVGDNTERARTVIDINGAISDYDCEKISSTKLTVTVTAIASEPSIQPPSTQQPQNPTDENVNQNENIQEEPTVSVSEAIEKKLIIIDSGHGGKDSGAVGYLDGKPILEKDLTLQIAKKVRDVLTESGYDVDMTRTTDKYLELTEPPAQANEENALIFVSVHINSVDSAPEANGTEVYYSVQNNAATYGTTSSVLAKNILTRMLYYMNSESRGVKTANHAVTKRCKMPAALVEVGFISNESELRKMCSDDYQNKIAHGIAEGIIKTINEIE